MNPSSASAGPAFFIIAVVALVAFLSVRQARSHDLAAVSIGSDSVNIRPRGVFSMVSFTRTLKIPLERIHSADLVPSFTMPPSGARRMGGAQFGDVSAGTFDGDWGRGFFLTSGAPTSLRIELTGGAYDVVVIDTPRARELATELRRASTAE